jgi:hypothetical protein
MIIVALLIGVGLLGCALYFFDQGRIALKHAAADAKSDTANDPVVKAYDEGVVSPDPTEAPGLDGQEIVPSAEVPPRQSQTPLLDAELKRRGLDGSLPTSAEIDQEYRRDPYWAPIVSDPSVGDMF